MALVERIKYISIHYYAKQMEQFTDWEQCKVLQEQYLSFYTEIEHSVHCVPALALSSKDKSQCRTSQ